MSFLRQVYNIEFNRTLSIGAPVSFLPNILKSAVWSWVPSDILEPACDVSHYTNLSF